MGKKLLYLSSWDFSNEESDGVCKKIKMQISAFTTSGFLVDLMYINDGKTYIKRADGSITLLGSNHHLSKFGAHKLEADFLEKEDYDFAYIRNNKADYWLIKSLKILKKNNTPIVMEFPTYPYDKECEDDIRSRVVLFVDKLYRNKQVRYVNRAAVYSTDERIFGIKAIRIVNGIDVNNTKLPTYSDDNSVIRILAVALMSKLQGYERVLNGLALYYKSGGDRNIQISFVGDGPALEYYKQIVTDNSLQEHVHFLGKRGGDELDKTYNNIDLGLALFGAYKIGFKVSSALKTREYLAKGIPIVTGCEIDVLKDTDFKFYCKFSDDDSLINFEKVVEFYDTIYQNENHINIQKQIRQFAFDTVDINITMKPVVDFFELDQTDGELK